MEILAQFDDSMEEWEITDNWENASIYLDDNFNYPVLLTAHKSNWRGQTGTATAKDAEDVISKVASFNGNVDLVKDNEEIYFKVWTHDVPTGFIVTIGEIDGNT